MRDSEIRELLNSTEHDWVKDDKGEIDFWAYECERHNGAMCNKCSYVICVHCLNSDQDSLEYVCN